MIGNVGEYSSISVHMTGSEWFGTRAGGLNRYFEALFVALSEQPGLSVGATAFGPPRPRGASWGDLTGGLTSRVRASRALKEAGQVDILDRHFAPYGPKRSQLRTDSALVTHFHGPWFAESHAEGEGTFKVRAKQWWERQRYAESDRAVVLCAEFGSVLERRFGFPGEKVRVIPPGVDLERFAAQPVAPADRPLVLCVRRLERRMGIDVLLNAWLEVVKAVPEARLGIVGEGSQRQALVSQAEALGLSSSVEFHGLVSDNRLNLLYANCALTVVPTRDLEGFGLIALESLASARPVIVTRVGGLPDSVEGLDPSLIVAPGQAAELAARLVSALYGAVPSGPECRSHAETFSWSRVGDRHRLLYQDLRS